jgi:biopolymer transport protein ExbD
VTPDAASSDSGSLHSGQGDPRPNDASATWSPPAGARVRLRRPASPFHVDLTPLIDVVFLLLTFFIYAMVLMDRIELVPLELKPLEAGESVADAAPPPARTLSLDGSGGLYLDREPIALDQVVSTLQATLEEAPDTVLYLAVSDEVGPTDRIPMLLELWNQLRLAEIPIKMVGRPGAGGS